MKGLIRATLALSLLFSPARISASYRQPLPPLADELIKDAFLTIPKLPSAIRGKPTLLASFCSDTGYVVLYPNRVSIYDPPCNETEQNKIVSHTLDYAAIGGAFVNEGREAIIAFGNGRIQHIWYTETEGIHIWERDLHSPVPLQRVMIGHRAKHQYLILPEIRKYIVFFIDEGEDTAYIGRISKPIPATAVLDCSGVACVIRNGEEIIEELRERSVR